MGELYHEVHDGRGPPLLLVHGMLASRAQWLPNLGALRSVCSPVVVELLGHGRSPSPEDPEAYRPERYVERFEQLRRELGAERWPICGQSLGAALTLRYALDHPERIPCQIFTNSSSALAGEGWEPLVRQAMQLQARRLEAEGLRALDDNPIHPRRSRRIPPEAREQLLADCQRHDPRGLALTGLHTVPFSSVRDRIQKNRVPSLLVVGENDARFGEQHRFAEAHMPHLEVVTTPAGHAVNLQAAEAFNAAATAFLARFS